MSVQQALEEAIAGFSGETVVTQAAGRTDAGVHAYGQVVSFDLATGREPHKVREALNFHLKPHPIAVLRAEKVTDSTTFRAAECQAKSPIKTLDRLDVSQQADVVVVTAAARSFLHHQVRSMVGSLKLVGEGRWTAENFREALDARDRSRCGTLAPAAGLYLMRVEYPSR
jgi:tRNA pseudouridine38-40 synthase